MTEKNMKWIYLRYIYPSVASFLSFLLLFLPCFRFITKGGNNTAVSLFELTRNSWEQGTRCLWGSGIEQSVGNIYFSRSVIIMVAVFYLLFIFAIAVSGYITVSAFLHFKKSLKGINLV